MQRVEIQVDRLRRYSADTSFDIYGDLGTGVIDEDHPLTPHPVRLWPQAATRRGHALDGHLSSRHLDSVDPDGHLEGTHLEDEHLYPARAATFATPWYVFGRFRHAIKMADGAGNVSNGVEAAITINSAPTVPLCVTRKEYDKDIDLLTFSFEPSRFAAMRGM